MPDVDRQLAALRDSLRDSMYQPEFDAVLTRHRQRKFRRRTQLAAAAAVLTVAAVLPVLRTQPELPRSAVPPASDRNVGAPVIRDIDFGDERTGYALRQVCADDVCDTDLLVTEDAQHWHPRELPAIDHPSRYGETLLSLNVLGPRRIMVESRVLPRTTPRWYSDDGGQSWREIPDEPAPDVAAIPDGAILRPRCIDEFCRHLGDVEVILPDSGRWAPLANQPPLDNPRPGPIPAGDGAWWVTGKDRTSGRAALALSRDAGRTWSVAILEGVDQPGLIDVTVGPDAMYATALGELDDGGLGLAAIFVSTDGGQTWSRTWYPALDKEPHNTGFAVAEPNGGLIVVAEAARVYRSTDHGRTFEATNERLGDVRRTRIGYLVATPDVRNAFFRIAPNATWSRIVIG